MTTRSSISIARLLLAGFLLFAIACVPASLQAQGTSATVSGIVSDPTGAKIPAAIVTFTNVATGAVAKGTTNSEGLYRITGLLPGSYNAAVTMQGFKTAIQQGIDLHLEDQVSLDYALALGASTESVTINADSSILETQSPTVSQVIEGRQVEDTPLNGRNTMNLVALTPGVVAQGGTQGAASNNTSGGGFTNANSFGNYSIAGGLASQESIYLDGAPLQIPEGNATAFVITQDAVQEFRVESSVVNPQYGGFSGGVISFGTKSGGSKIHGSFYEYFRNTAFNANNFINNLNNIARPKFNQNQFGATVGGAIRKDKIFYFASYEGYRLAQGVINAGRVPTPAELTGDFTADPKVINPVPTLGPMVGPGVYASATYAQATCGGVANKFCVGAPVNPGDAVVDPTAYYLANTLHYFPKPNTTTNGASINFVQNGKAYAFTNQESFRIDDSLNAKNRLFARYTRFDRTQAPTVFFPGNNGPQASTGVGATVSQYVLGNTTTLNPTSVLDVRISYLRYFSYLIPGNQNVNLAALDNGDTAGFYAGAAHEILPYFPDINMTNNAPYPFTALNQGGQQPNNLYTISGTYSKQFGRHSLSFGGEVRQAEEYYFNQPFLTGDYIFAGTSTACIAAGAGTVTFNDAAHTALAKNCPAGAPVIPGSGATPEADFISGQFAASATGFTTTAPVSAVNHNAGIFANDSFVFSSKLTVTAGLRYELPGSFFVKNDNNAVLLPQLANPLVLVNSAAYPGRGDLQAHHELFSPRVGFSYAPYNGATFRAGYSLAFLGQDTAFPASPVYSSLNSPETFVNASYQLCAPLGYVTTGTAAGNPCNAPGSTARTAIIQPLTRAQYAANPAIFNGQPLEGREPYGKFPYLEQYNANVQQTMGSSTVIQLAFLGARGEHMPIAGTFDINQIPDTAAIGATSQASRPYPTYQTVLATAPYIGDTYYDSAQVTLTKRFKSGGTILGNYSWSKFLGNSEATNPQVESHTQGGIQDYTNLRGERSYLSFDVPQHLVVSYILDLPVGRGKHFLANASPALNAAVGGWNVSGINTLQSGFPLAIVGSPTAVSAAFGGGTPRPNVIPGCIQKSATGFVASAQSSVTSTPISTFNKACFAATGPAAGATAYAYNYLGNQPRTSGILRTQGTDNFDFSVGKTIPIHEAINIVFRGEAFNVWNRVQFGDPGLTFGSATFGVPITQANLPRSFQFSLRANY